MTEEHKKGMEELSARLGNHDWFYDMSDDHSAWKAGSADWAEIAAMAKKLGRDGERLLKAYHDIHYHPGAGFEYKYD